MGDPCGRVVTDQRSQRRYHGEAVFHQLTATSFVRFDANDAFFSERIDRIGAKFNGFKQFKRNNWHRHIQFKVPGLAAKGNRRIAADDMGGPWITDFAENRIDFARMIDEPGCVSGRPISPMAQRGPEASQRRSLPILIRLTDNVLSAPLT